MNKLSKVLFVDGFWIKVVALLTMTLSHIAILLELFLSKDNNTIVVVFDSFGRISLPLFCFGIAEGVSHTKSFGKYSLRLGILASAISTFLLVSRLVDIPGAYSISNLGNIFIDLLLGAVSIYLLKQEKWYLKLLSLLPIALSFISFFSNHVETSGVRVDWFPWFIRTQYGFYGTLLAVVFYFADVVADAILTSHASKLGFEKDVIYTPVSTRFVANLFSIMFLAIITIFFGAMDAQFNTTLFLSYQYYAIAAGVLIFFYNGKRGYNAKWFQYGAYLYYPVHLIVIVLIYLLLSL